MEVKRIDAINITSKPFRHKESILYRKVIGLFLAKLGYYLITTGFKIKLPSGFGSLQIVKFKHKFQHLDFHKTKLNNIKTYHTNDSTNGYWVRLHWYRRESKIKGKRNLLFTISRPLLRPNSYNKNNPKVSLVPYFKENGDDIYIEKYKYDKINII